MGTPTYIPQNDPHDTLIVLNIYNWGKKIFKKICPSTQAPISQGPTQRSGRVKILFCAFHPFFNSPQNSEYFEYRHIGSNKKFPPAVCVQKNLRRLWRPQNPLFHTTIWRCVEGGGGGGLGSGSDQEQPPCQGVTFSYLGNGRRSEVRGPMLAKLSCQESVVLEGYRGFGG